MAIMTWVVMCAQVAEVARVGMTASAEVARVGTAAAAAAEEKRRADGLCAELEALRKGAVS